jgi:hypothetical protein
MLHIDHYDGAYGPIISLEVDSAPDLARLRAIFHGLARDGTREIELVSAMATRVLNLAELRLRRDDSPGARRLVRSRSYERSHGPRPPSFVWSDSRAGWSRRVEIVDTLLRRNGAAQHDLTREGVDGALIELSFLQPR